MKKYIPLTLLLALVVAGLFFGVVINDFYASSQSKSSRKNSLVRAELTPDSTKLDLPKPENTRDPKTKGPTAVEPPSAPCSHGLSSSLFARLIEKTSCAPSSFLPYPPAPLYELSEQEGTEFPGARVVDAVESESGCFMVRQRLLDVSTSFKYPYIKTEELLDKESKKLISRLEMVANQFLIVLPEETPPDQFLKDLGKEALSIRRISQSEPIYAVTLSEAFLDSLPKALKKIENVNERSEGTLMGEPDYIGHAAQRPSNYGYGYQWGLWKVNDFDFLQKPYCQFLYRLFHHINWLDSVWKFSWMIYFFPKSFPSIDICDFQEPLSSEERPSCYQHKDYYFQGAEKKSPEEYRDAFSRQHGINAEEGWDIRTSAESVVVAVVDTGIRYTHHNLKNNMWHNPDPDHRLHDYYGKNFVTGNGDPNDDYGHGTHCAGIIGGEANDTLGAVGVASKVQLMACKVVDKAGRGTTSDFIEGLDYAKEHHADIVNVSLGFSISFFNNYLRSLETELLSLQKSGIILVAGAGNDGIDQDHSSGWSLAIPAAWSTQFDNIVSVGATESFGPEGEKLAEYSNYGVKKTSLAAPGSFILSTWNSSDNAYAFADGTSMATPFVTGALALMKAEFPTWSYQDLITHLIKTTDPLPSLNGKIRGGRLNLARALRPTPLMPPPPVAVTPPPPLLQLDTGILPLRPPPPSNMGL